MHAYTASDFADLVKTYSNEDLVQRGVSAILGAAISNRYMSGNRDDALASAIRIEAARRDNPDLYMRAYNEAVTSQGYSDMAGPVTTPISHGEEHRVIPTAS